MNPRGNGLRASLEQAADDATADIDPGLLSERLIARARSSQPIRSRRQWIIPLLAATAVAVLATSTALIADHSDHRSVPVASSVPAPSISVPPTSTPTSASPTAPSSSPTPSTSAPTTPVATQIVVLRPVTANGAPAPGYTVGSVPIQTVEKCGASFYTQDANVYGCSPTSANAIACLKSTGGTLLCLTSPQSHVLIRVRPSDTLPLASAPASPLPLGVSLTSGAQCSAYYNGTNPGAGNLFAAYGCDQDVGIFASIFLHPFDVSSAQWTAQLFNADGSGSERTGYVQTAYYVGAATA